ncbi:hypothetical protein EGW08_016923 [Elysia chlorotica]|uniref:Uncharacterized protein n=1 Tax=Elysia chlorotica TaxID=188477 RepID=A0A3S0ZHZ5_ELYCH|nr:hypothetical protein EGW08_016923 [Elysia chlorotica]
MVAPLESARTPEVSKCRGCGLRISADGPAKGKNQLSCRDVEKLQTHAICVETQVSVYLAQPAVTIETWGGVACTGLPGQEQADMRSQIGVAGSTNTNKLITPNPAVREDGGFYHRKTQMSNLHWFAVEEPPVSLNARALRSGQLEARSSVRAEVAPGWRFNYLLTSGRHGNTLSSHHASPAQNHQELVQIRSFPISLQRTSRRYKTVPILPPLSIVHTANKVRARDSTGPPETSERDVTTVAFLLCPRRKGWPGEN